MPWNPNVPAVTNRVQDDLNAIRENFQHLDQLAERVDELQTVSGLAPVANELQTVSGLAQGVDELQAVGELAPYVQALLESRIVEMDSNSNGEYVRWENGLQLAWLIEQNVSLSLSTTSLQGLTIYWQNRLWTFPASFIAPPAVLISLDLGLQVEMPSTEMAPPSNTSIAYSVTSLMSQTNARVICLLAIGRWK